MFSSELLDLGGFPTARESIRRPEPHEHRPVGWDLIAEVDPPAGAVDAADGEVGERAVGGFWADRDLRRRAGRGDDVGR